MSTPKGGTPRRIRANPIILGIFAAAASLASASASFRAAADPAKEIRAVLDRQVADWNRGDLDAFVDSYWKSPKLVFLSGGDRNNGWEAMRDRYRKRYQSEGREMGRLEFTELESFEFGPDAGFTRGRWRLTMKDGATPNGWFTVILRRLPEGWRIVHDHTSVAPDPPAGAKREP